MTPDVQKAVENLLTKNARVFAVATGGGAGFQNMLWSVPGSSSFLVGAAFPYAKEDTASFLGFEPDKFCSLQAAISLASEAYKRAWQLGSPTAYGLGLTASVASNREHRGAHRVYSAVVTDNRCHVLYNESLPKGVGTVQRGIDGAICDHLALNSLLDALGEKTVWPKEIWTKEAFEGVEMKQLSMDSLRELFFQQPFFERGRRTTTDEAEIGTQHVLFPGAFNPPHEGHVRIAQTVEEISGRRVVFHVTDRTPHKEPIGVPELLQRANMIQACGFPVMFSNDTPMYIDKARRFPGADFIIGADGLKRMLDPVWGVDPKVIIKELTALRTRFWVFGRSIDGSFINAREACVSLPSGVFIPVAGRWDISSTDVREAMRKVSGN